MSISSRIERMFGGAPLPQSQALDTAQAEAYMPSNIDESGQAVMPLSPPPVYEQWYERDGQLANAEKESLAARCSDVECMILPDGRACFSAIVAGKQTAFICQYAHPLEPVTVQILDDIDAPSVVDATGKVDLFAHDGFAWNSEVRLGDVAQHVATMLSVSAANASKGVDTHVADETRDVS